VASLFIAGRIGSRTSSPSGLLHGLSITEISADAKRPVLESEKSHRSSVIAVNLILTFEKDGVCPISTFQPLNRALDAIRVEIVAAAYNFLAERLEPVQHEVTTKMKKMLSATSLNEFLESGLDICKNVFPGEEGLFADGACK